jgi:hypothetical protein
MKNDLKKLINHLEKSIEIIDKYGMADYTTHQRLEGFLDKLKSQYELIKNPNKEPNLF